MAVRLNVFLHLARVRNPLAFHWGWRQDSLPPGSYPILVRANSFARRLRSGLLSFSFSLLEIRSELVVGKEDNESAVLFYERWRTIRQSKTKWKEAQKKKKKKK